MNSASEDPAALPLHELEIAPEWVRTGGKSFESHTGEDRKQGRGDGRRGPRPQGQRPRDQDRPRDRERGPGGPPRRPSGPPRGKGAPRRDDRERPRQPAAPAPAPVDVAFLPDEKAFTVMIEAMKQAPRAYALFDIAKLILNKPERHLVKLARKAGPDGKRSALFVAIEGECPFFNQDEALRFALRRQGEKVFKQIQKPVDPPKGNFAFVNRCGITGEWLGPPNYHEYQSRLIRHHQQRLRHMPFEDFKSSIQTIRDPEAVKAWVESKSFITEYQCVLDAEPIAFSSREDLMKHVTENHLAQLVTCAPEVQVSGLASRQIEHRGILEAVREGWNAERRFPLKTASVLSERLRKEGFHFFKRKGATFVTHTKLNRFESIAGLGERVQKIMTFLRAHPDSTRKHLLENFPLSVSSPEPAEASAEITTPAPETTAPVPALETAGVAPAPLLTEQDQLFADLHWLIQDGYVVEFSDGRLWALEDKPPKPVAEPAAPTEGATATSTEQPAAVTEEAAPATDQTPGAPEEQPTVSAPVDEQVDTPPAVPSDPQQA